MIPSPLRKETFASRRPASRRPAAFAALALIAATIPTTVLAAQGKVCRGGTIRGPHGYNENFLCPLSQAVYNDGVFCRCPGTKIGQVFSR